MAVKLWLLLRKQLSVSTQYILAILISKAVILPSPEIHSHGPCNMVPRRPNQSQIFSVKWCFLLMD